MFMKTAASNPDLWIGERPCSDGPRGEHLLALKELLRRGVRSARPAPHGEALVGWTIAVEHLHMVEEVLVARGHQGLIL